VWMCVCVRLWYVVGMCVECGQNWNKTFMKLLKSNLCISFIVVLIL